MDKLTKEQRIKNMQAVKCKGSKIENLMAKHLWSNGLRYRRNDCGIPGKPDFTFRGKKIAIFVDSEFWHGKDWELKKHELKSNREFWLHKIESNIKRDKYVNKTLDEMGWDVLRFWGKDIVKDIDSCLLQIRSIWDAKFTTKKSV